MYLTSISIHDVDDAMQGLCVLQVSLFPHSKWVVSNARARQGFDSVDESTQLFHMGISFENLGETDLCTMIGSAAQPEG